MQVAHVCLSVHIYSVGVHVGVCVYMVAYSHGEMRCSHSKDFFCHNLDSGAGRLQTEGAEVIKQHPSGWAVIACDPLV